MGLEWIKVRRRGEGFVGTTSKPGDSVNGKGSSWSTWRMYGRELRAAGGIRLSHMLPSSSLPSLYFYLLFPLICLSSCCVFTFPFVSPLPPSPHGVILHRRCQRAAKLFFVLGDCPTLVHNSPLWSTIPLLAFFFLMVAPLQSHPPLMNSCDRSTSADIFLRRCRHGSLSWHINDLVPTWRVVGSVFSHRCVILQQLQAF